MECNNGQTLEAIIDEVLAANPEQRARRSTEQAKTRHLTLW
jgi:hypothetical protein